MTVNKKQHARTSSAAEAPNTGPTLPLIQQHNQLLVDARLLHQRLEVKVRFNDWIKRRIQEYGFVKNEDFFKVAKNSNANLITQNSEIKIKHGGDRKSIEYYFTLDTGKELAMLEGNEAGRAIRRYFIEAEKQLRSTRLYAATATLSELGRSFKPLLLNGRKLYPFRAVAESLGYNPGISISRFSERGWGNLFVKIGNKTWCAEEYVKVMMARAKCRVVVAEAKAANPVLPENFGELPAKLKGGSHE